jgi:hypothetical protein
MFDQTTATATDETIETTAPAWLRLHHEMKSETRAQSSWDARRARHLREAEAQQLWHHFGYVSILEYLEREHGIEPRTASDRLRVSHALADLPMLEAELEEGTFQYSHVKELTRIVTPETEDEWIEAARGKTCGEVQAMVAGRKRGDGPDDPDQPDLRLRWLTIGLPPQTEVMYRELRASIDAELGHRVEEAEAFRIILERAAACPDGASTPAQISISERTGRGWREGAGGRAELSPAEIATALCDAEHLGSGDGEWKTATLTKRKRERIIARDQHRCAVPGCRSKKHLDVHHIKHREHGGGHEDSNLITLCSGHHRAHHEGRLAIDGLAPDRMTFEWTVPPQMRTNQNHAHAGTKPGQAARFGDAVMRTQARDALVGLGWKPGIARAAVDEASAHVGIDVPIERLIQEALRRCPKPLG